MNKATIPVSAIWTRKLGGEIQVLAEVGGKFRLIQTHPIDWREIEVSHITESGGIEDAPEDHL